MQVTDKAIDIVWGKHNLGNIVFPALEYGVV